MLMHMSAFRKTNGSAPFESVAITIQKGCGSVVLVGSAGGSAAAARTNEPVPETRWLHSAEALKLASSEACLIVT